jgi:hypothetical protein
MQFDGAFDIDGTVPVTGKIRIFGMGRNVTTIHQITKPLPTFYVTEYSFLRGPCVVRVSAGVRSRDLRCSAPVLVWLSAT